MTALVPRDDLAAGIQAGRVTVVDALPATYWAQQHLPGALDLVRPPDGPSTRRAARRPHQVSARPRAPRLPADPVTLVRAIRLAADGRPSTSGTGSGGAEHGAVGRGRHRVCSRATDRADRPPGTPRPVANLSRLRQHRDSAPRQRPLHSIPWPKELP
jgi:hypothetical protein